MTTTTKKNLHQRLAEAMAAVRYVQKEKKQGMQYSVVSHDHVTAKVRPALLDAGIVYYPVNLEHVQNGNRTEITLSVRFVNTDNPEDFIEVPSLGFGIDQQDKGPGKAISYAVKYALLKALGLETGDDPDYHQDVAHTIDENQAATIQALAEEVEADISAFCEWMKVDSIESIPATSYDKAIKALEKKREQEAA